jgi:hypothetical protein
VASDNAHKFIRKWDVRDAAVSDGQNLMHCSTRPTRTGIQSIGTEGRLAKLGFNSRVHQKAARQAARGETEVAPRIVRVIGAAAGRREHASKCMINLGYNRRRSMIRP